MWWRKKGGQESERGFGIRVTIKDKESNVEGTTWKMDTIPETAIKDLTVFVKQILHDLEKEE